MSVFNGGDVLESTNLVNALFECGFKCNDKELQYNEEFPSTPVDNVSFAIDGDQRTATITATLPIKDIREDGVVNVSGRNYMSDVGELPDDADTGDLTSRHYPGLLYELTQMVSQEERKIRPTVVQVTPNTVTINNDFESRQATITCTIPLVPVWEDGALKFVAQDFIPNPA